MPHVPKKGWKCCNLYQYHTYIRKSWLASAQAQKRAKLLLDKIDLPVEQIAGLKTKLAEASERTRDGRLLFVEIAFSFALDNLMDPKSSKPKGSMRKVLQEQNSVIAKKRDGIDETCVQQVLLSEGRKHV